MGAATMAATPVSERAADHQALGLCTGSQFSGQHHDRGQSRPAR